MARISLNLIFKNEAKVLLRLLESVYPIIDYYVCVDTGSTDNSKEIITTFFQQKGIEGEIYDFPYNDGLYHFDEWRNLALNKTRESVRAKELGIDYGFYIDCKEQLILSPNFTLAKFRKELSLFDRGSLIVEKDGLNILRIPFFKLSIPLTWKEPVHEYMHCDSPSYYPIPDMKVIAKADGSSSTDQNVKVKYLRYAFTLHAHFEKYNDPRTLFYLAQSYKDAGETEIAIKYFRLRAERTDGYIEERFYAQYYIGILTHGKDFKDNIFEHLKAFELDNLRAEPLLNIIARLRENNMWHTAFIVSSYLMAQFNGKPPARTFFINDWTYNGGILDSHKQILSKLGMVQELTKYVNAQEIYDNYCSTPSDINEHLPVLKKYAEKVPSVTEFGFRSGCSTYALLMAKPRKLFSYDLNYDLNIECVKALSEKEKVDFQFIQGDVLKLKIKDTGLLFIDTVGNYGQLSEELKLHSGSVKKYIIVHDTVAYGKVNENPGNGKQGLQLAIEDFLAVNKEWKLESVYQNNNGLAVIERGVWGNDRKILFSDFEKKKAVSNVNQSAKAVINDILSGIESPFSKFGDFSDWLVKELSPEVTVDLGIDYGYSTFCFARPGIGKVIGIDYFKGDSFVGERDTYDAVKLNAGIINTAIGSNNIEIIKGKFLDVVKTWNKKIDLLHFDGFHGYHDLKADFDNWSKFLNESGVILFHGTVGYNGVKLFFAELQWHSKKPWYQLNFSHSTGLGIASMNKEIIDKIRNTYLPEFIDVEKKQPEIKVIEVVDVCIISDAKTPELKTVTETGIRSLFESETDVIFNVIVVESNKDVEYDFQNTMTLHPEVEFGYHKYLNIARKAGNANFVVLCNNDLTYEKGWASEIIRQMKEDISLLSVSPLCPQTQNKNNFPQSIYYGYQVRRELAGWCIFQRRSIYSIIGDLDEYVKYWYSDNDYSMTLQKFGVKHALVTGSVVNHHEKNHGATGEVVLGRDQAKLNEYTYGQRMLFCKKWNLPV